MKEVGRIRCRVAACRESQGGGDEWRFYLINDGDAALDSAVLDRVSSEWGDFGYSDAADVHVTGLAPGATALIWRDDGEYRMELSLLARAGDREARLSFEFPRLYRQKNLTPVGGLGKRGWVESAEV